MKKLRINNWSGTYAFGYVLVSIGFRTFYKKYKITGKHNLPKGKPIIYAANHQNAFMDPILISVTLSNPTYYMVRADIFKNKIAAAIFESINMMPIYRQRDGVDTLEKNKAVFDRCYDLLSLNRPIIIFPEGNHGEHKRLRPLKKGVFRIGIGAEEKYNNDLDVHIIPVGLNYSNSRNMNATFLLNYGEPIRLKDYLKSYEEEPNVTLNDLTKKLSKEMSKQMIDIKNLDHYDLVNNSLVYFRDEINNWENNSSKDLLDVFNAQKAFINKAENDLNKNPKQDELVQIEKEFSDHLKALNIRSWLLRDEDFKLGKKIALLVLGLPIFIYGAINSYIPYSIPVWFVNKKVKDLQFHSSLKMALGTFGFMIFWSLQTILVSVFTDDYIWAIYAASLFPTAFVAYKWNILRKKVSGIFKFNKLSKSNSEKANKIKKQYNDLKNYFNSLY